MGERAVSRASGFRRCRFSGIGCVGTGRVFFAARRFELGETIQAAALPFFRLFCEAPKARDARALEEAVRGGAGGEDERLSSLPLFRNWLCCVGIRALWRGDTGSAGANAAIGFEKRRRGRRDVGRGIFQTRIRPERAFTREGLPLMRPRLYPRGGKLPDVLWSGKGKVRFKHGYAQSIGQKSSKNRNLFDNFKKTNYKNSAKKMVK